MIPGTVSTLGTVPSTKKDGNIDFLLVENSRYKKKNFIEKYFRIIFSLPCSSNYNMSNKEFKVQIRERSDPSEDYKRPELRK